MIHRYSDKVVRSICSVLDDNLIDYHISEDHTKIIISSNIDMTIDSLEDLIVSSIDVEDTVVCKVLEFLDEDDQICIRLKYE